MPYLGRSTEAFGVRSRFTFLASADDTSVSGNDVNGLPLSFTDGAYVDVFLNGVRLKHNTDYVTTTANTISSLAALAANDEIEVVVFDVFSLADMVSSANGGNFFNQVNFKTDSAVVAFGADNDVTLTHVADTGLKLKNTSTSGNSGVGAILTLQTGDTDIAQDNILGQIDFQAPDEGTGTDAILKSALIRAKSEGDFSSSSNATSLELMVAKSATVGSGTDGARLMLNSDANLFLKDLSATDGSSPILTFETGDTDIAQDDILGTINFQAPDEGTGTDAILVAAGISAVSEGDFSSSSNATKLVFKTASSEAAAEKMSLSSGGLLTVSGRIITDDTTEATSTTDGSLQTDGGLSVAKDIVAGDDVKLLSDSAVLSFGADSEIQLIHSHNSGLLLKHANTADDSTPVLTFQTGDTDIAQDDVLGAIKFQAPDEGAGTDAILVAAGIDAISEGDFSASSNATSLVFKTGASETATEKMRIASDGKIGIGIASPLSFNVQIDKSSTDTTLTDLTDAQLILSNTGTATTNQHVKLGFRFQDGTHNGQAMIAAVRESNSARTSSLRFYSAPSSDGDPDERLKIEGAGDVVVSTGDLIFATSGKGVNLGVTSNTDSNTLDDYEEGTWSGTLRAVAGSAGTVAGNTSDGHYLKVGNAVNIMFTCNLNNLGSYTANANVAVYGLPFTAGGYINHPLTLGFHDFHSNSTTRNIQVQVTANQAYVYHSNPDSTITVWNDIGTGLYSHHGWYRTDF